MIINTITLAALAAAVAAWSPTNGYAPGNVSCPSSSTAGNSSNGDINFVRAATGISTDEEAWLEKRHEITDAALKKFLTSADLTDFDVDSFFDKVNSSINIGLAFSGGGYRAMLCGAGQISALDNRTTGAAEHGLGGLLQSATYLAGLSGGNWLTGTLALNNWTSVEEIISNDTIWDLTDSIFSSGGWNIIHTFSQWDDVGDAIDDKQDAGFNTSITDIWGRLLSYQFFGNNDEGSVGLTFSTLRDADVFKNAEMPFPFSVADGRVPGTQIISLNSTVFEFNPFEMGSWDPSLYAFTDLKYLGTNVSNGVPVDDQCIAGFDNAGFVLGTSSSLFNQFILQLNTTGISGVVYDIVEHFLDDLSEDYDDIAIYDPNPFKDTTYSNVESISSNEYLYLCDGGEDLQNVPLAPLLQPERAVDIIFAYDNSADTDDYLPNGASLVATYERQFVSDVANGTSFPYVPGQSTFIGKNLTSKPTFFGCNASNLTGLSIIPPIVVYTANTPFSYWSNTSTYKMAYEDEEKKAMIQNGFEVASRYNRTIDEDWLKCVACAIIRRPQERLNITQSDECKECFSTYCWDSSLDTDASTSQSGNWTSSKDIDAPNDSGVVSSSSIQEAGISASRSAGGESTNSANTASTSAKSTSKSGAGAVVYYEQPAMMRYAYILIMLGSIALFF